MLNSTKVKIIVVVTAIFLAIFAGKIFETNNSGYYLIKQAALTGKVSAINRTGVILQAFGSIFKYQLSGMYHFSSSNLDGGSGQESDPITVRFNDGGTADVSGSIKFKLSSNNDNQKELHEDFKSFRAVRVDLIRQVVAEALMQTASIMKAEESYSSRRAEFTALVEDQIKYGIYDTELIEKITKDAEGNDFIKRSVKIIYDKTGKPIIRKPSPFLRYKIEILQFVIKNLDFDATIDNLIAKKKESEQQRVVARANAEKAKQDAITAKEEGNAAIAVAKAKKEVEKIEAVTNAMKEYEVAKYNTLKAIEEANARLVKQRAEAAANRLLVQAGLTPKERAEFARDTAIGVAKATASFQPAPNAQIVVLGGNGKGGAISPFEMLNLKAMNDMLKSKKVS